MRSASILAGAVIIAIGAAAPAPAQPRAADGPTLTRARAELRELVADVNAALRRRDRAALEILYAPEYIWVHGNGYVNDLATHLDEELSVDSVIPLPLTFEPPEQLRIYRDVAVLRRPFRSAVAMHHGQPALSTWIFARRRGRWQIVQQQVTILQPDRDTVSLPAALLDAYAGDYGEQGTVTTRIRRESGSLISRGVPLRNPPRVLVAVSDSTFFDKLGTEYVFERSEGGGVVAIRLHLPDGRVVRRQRLR